MDETNLPRDERSTRRILGLLLMAGAVLWAALLVWQVGAEPGRMAQPTLVATAAPVGANGLPEVPATTAAAIAAPATPWEVAGFGAVASPTADVTAAPLVEGVVTVYGPPAESVFRLDESITFYWSWPEPLAEGQQFSLFLRSNAGEQRIGTISEANLGRAYWLSATLADRVAGPGPVAWHVRLEDIAGGQTFARSQERLLSLRGE